MNRRELLGAVGLGATGVAGLVGESAGGAERETTTGAATTEATTTGGGFTGIESAADRPFATITVGTRAGVRNPENDRPHLVRVWNDGDRPRTIGLRLARSGDPATLDRRVEFPADGYLTLRLLEPGDYALAVRPGAGASDRTRATATTANGGSAAGETIEISREQFDCNDSRTDVRVAADGAVQSVTTATETDCPPDVTGRTFTSLGGSCGSADDASVAFGAESVTVEGSIRAPNPCYGARLARVALPTADTLRVTVTTTEPSAGVCAQCVANVGYRANVQFGDRVPETVEVVHRRGERSETVATVSRDGSGTTAGG